VLSVQRAAGHSLVAGLAGFVDDVPVQSIYRLPYMDGSVFSGGTTTVALRLYVLPLAQSGHPAHQVTYDNGNVAVSKIYIRAILTRYGISEDLLVYHVQVVTPSFPDLGYVTSWAPTPLNVNFTLDGSQSSGWKLDITHLGYLA